MNKVIAVSCPKVALILKVESESTAKPAIGIAVVTQSAVPTVEKAYRTAASASAP